MTIGESNPPPPATGTNPGGSIDTAMPGGDVSALLPAIPPTPTADSTWQAWDIYLRALAIHVDSVLRHNQAVASAAHAAAQAETAAVMREASATQNALLQAMNAPPAPMTREQLVLHLLTRLPEVTGLTDLGVVDLAIKRADAFRQRFPAA